MNSSQKIQTFYLHNPINLEFRAIVIDFWVVNKCLKADQLHRDWDIKFLRGEKTRSLKYGFCMAPVEFAALRIMEKLPKKKR